VSFVVLVVVADQIVVALKSFASVELTTVAFAVLTVDPVVEVVAVVLAVAIAFADLTARFELQFPLVILPSLHYWPHFSSTLRTTVDQVC
jgi:hypothetical protein